MRLTIVFFLMCSSLLAQGPKVKVAPWNNHTAALSLTFDDALEVHLDIAGPELNKRHLRGSFFLTVDQITRFDDWKKLQTEGHELGNHSVTHALADGLAEETSKIEVITAKNFLESNFKTPMLDYAYPYGVYNDYILKFVRQNTFLARAVTGANYYIPSHGLIPWFDIPAHEAGRFCDGVEKELCSKSIFRTWIDTTIYDKAWMTFVIHGIGDDASGYNPLPKLLFEYLLDYSCSRKNLWIAPFIEVGAYLKGEQMFEKASIFTNENKITYTWEYENNAPPGIVLKICIPSGSVYQNGAPVLKDSDGLYPIRMDLKEMTISGGRK